VQTFIAQGNIDRFLKLVELESDPMLRQRLETLLAEERVKLHSGCLPTERNSTRRDHLAAQSQSQGAGSTPAPDGQVGTTPD
jgi:hypothetical protein